MFDTAGPAGGPGSSSRICRETAVQGRLPRPSCAICGAMEKIQVRIAYLKRKSRSIQKVVAVLQPPNSHHFSNSHHPEMPLDLGKQKVVVVVAVWWSFSPAAKEVAKSLVWGRYFFSFSYISYPPIGAVFWWPGQTATKQPPRPPKSFMQVMAVKPEKVVAVWWLFCSHHFRINRKNGYKNV